MKPLETLLHLIESQPEDIEKWFENEWQGLTPLPYFSCDLRHSDFKIGIVDTNLFPGGFNNLCSTFSQKTTEAFITYFDEHFPNIRNVALLSENHTRNKFYLSNVSKIQDFIISTQKNCLLTLALDHWPQDSVSLNTEPKTTITFHKPEFENGNLNINQFPIDMVLSNNDFSTALTEDWEQLQIPVMPPLALGWSQRKKSTHFEILEKKITEFSQEFKIDPWLFLPKTQNLGQINEDNLSSFEEKIDNFVAEIQKKYNDYQIQEEPYVYLKNNSGTYGLGVLPIQKGSDLTNLNRKSRQKLFAKKSGDNSQEFLIQEGIPTYDNYSGYPIEPVIYGVGENSVGGFFRFHTKKDPFESLNAPGMEFSCLCLHKLTEEHESNFVKCEEKEKLVQAANFLVRFASLAAAHEAQIAA